jgi:hypothetical protein
MVHPTGPAVRDNSAETASTSEYGEDFLRLPGGHWSVWRCLAVRSAGFPVRLVHRLADPILARAADQCVQESTDRRRGDPQAIARYEAEFDAAASRATEATWNLAQDRRFREALAWQNRTFLATGVDRLTRHSRRDSRLRRREAAVTSYVQRYAAKNDSIGFFGPIGWGSWQPAGPAVTVRAAPDLLSRRTVYFESWAIDAVGATLAARPEVLPGVPTPRNCCWTWPTANWSASTSAARSMRSPSGYCASGCCVSPTRTPDVVLYRSWTT